MLIWSAGRSSRYSAGELRIDAALLTSGLPPTPDILTVHRRVSKVARSRHPDAGNRARDLVPFGAK
jgi:hypothetical protein